MSHRILVVDDEAPIRELLSLYLRKHGFEVETAHDAGQGRHLAQMTVFDLVILDLDLAGENGLELLKLLKRAQTKAPVLIVTALGCDERLRTDVMAHGAVALISKSESLHTLGAAIEAQLNPRRALPSDKTPGNNVAKTAQPAVSNRG